MAEKISIQGFLEIERMVAKESVVVFTGKMYILTSSTPMTSKPMNTPDAIILVYGMKLRDFVDWDGIY